MISPYVGIDEDVKVVLEIEQARRKRGRDKSDDQRSRHRRIRKGHIENVDLMPGGA